MSDPTDGDIRRDPWSGEEFEVVWSGGALLGPRDTRITDPGWQPPKRLYNRRPKDEIEAQRAATPVINEELSDEIDQAFIRVQGDGGDDD